MWESKRPDINAYHSLLSFLNINNFGGICFENLHQLSFVANEHSVFFDSVVPATVTSSLPLKDLIFRANRNRYFLPSQNFQQQVSIELVRSTSNLILPPAVYCCIFLDEAQVYCIPSRCSVFEQFTKTPFVCECLGRKIPFAEFKCERGNNLKL